MQAESPSTDIPQRGERLLRHAGALDPSHRKPRRYLALYLLARGRFAEGWVLASRERAPAIVVRALLERPE